MGKHGMTLRIPCDRIPATNYLIRLDNGEKYCLYAPHRKNAAETYGDREVLEYSVSHRNTETTVRAVIKHTGQTGFMGELL